MTGSRQCQVTTAGDNLTTIIIQTVCEAHERKCSDFGPLSGLLNLGAAKKLGWQSNPGAVIELLLNSMGVEFSADGKALWRRSDADTCCGKTFVYCNKNQSINQSINQSSFPVGFVCLS